MWFEHIFPKSMGWKLNPQHNTVDFLELWVTRAEDKHCYHSRGIATVEGVPNKGTNPASSLPSLPTTVVHPAGLLVFTAPSSTINSPAAGRSSRSRLP